MRSVDRALLLAALLFGLVGTAAHAGGRRAGQTPAPQAVPAGGPTVELAKLDDPLRLEEQLRRLLRQGNGTLRLSVSNGHARLGDFAVGPGETVPGDLLVLKGDADLFGRVSGNVVTLDGDIVLHSGATVTGSALAIGGRVRDRGGVVQGEQRSLGAAAGAEGAGRGPRAAAGGPGTALTRLAGFVGVFLTLTLLGFGMVLVAQPNLETISDTAAHSALRSFVAGLLAQVLVLPTLGMVVTGLVLSVVGILLVPFVAIAAALLLFATIVGGFLAVAHAMGETRVRRRMARGLAAGSANSYRYLLTGLGGIAAAWLGWILFAWVPVAGTVMFLAAFLATWLLATTGFGACLLSRAGIKPAFAGRYLPSEAVTDEYLWATPQFGVTAARRPPGGGPTPPRRS
ncbi:MAG TPA: hypothetical protein VGQ17_03970 [Gemmatimonadales bacterium]|jgi:hypothetical protein|nr:hypothetical protein [Gemmatimonadales bacterium]